MNRQITLAMLASTILLFPLGASANDSETIRTEEKIAPIDQQTTVTTTAPGDPLFVQNGDGSATIVQPLGQRTVETQTMQEAPIMQKTVIVKKKKSSHHLVNFLGLKIL